MDEFIYEKEQEFLNKVREAYRESLQGLSEEEKEDFRCLAQDSLSLYSPWFNEGLYNDD